MSRSDVKWMVLIFTILPILSRAQDMSNLGNIVLEQDPRQQDPFYRQHYARAGGMPLAAVNSVVHNVKHQSEGRFHIWDDLPSHRVRPGYTTTTKAPKIKTTTALWVRGRPRSGTHHQPPWYQNDPDMYDTGADYEDDGSSKHNGRKPAGRGGSRGRRPPPPMAPVRVKSNDLVDILEGSEIGENENIKSGDVTPENKKQGKKVSTSSKKVSTTTSKAKTTNEPTRLNSGSDDEGMRQPPGGIGGGGGGEGLAIIDLSDVKNSGVQNLRTGGDGEGMRVKNWKSGGNGGEEKKDEEDEEDDDDDEDEEEKKKKKKKKKGKKDKKDKKEKKKGKKKKDKKEGKKKGKGKKDADEDEEEDDDDDDEDEDEDDEEDENGEMKKVDGEVKLPKAIDGDTDGLDDDEDEDEEDEYDEDGEHEDHKLKKKKTEKKWKRKGNQEDDEEEEEEEEDSDDIDENTDGEKKSMNKKKKKKPWCPPSQKHQSAHQKTSTPPNKVQYSNQYPYGWTYPPITTTTTTTASPAYVSERGDYHNPEGMDCKEKDDNGKEDDYEEEEEEEHEKKKKRKKGKKGKKNKKRKNEKKRKRGKKRNQSLDYLTSKEKIDQNKRNRGNIRDELNADRDLKKIRNNPKSEAGGIECSTAVDEFPMKCGAWKDAGFCETNQATQFLWCRKTCLCSISTTTKRSSTTTSMSTSSEESEE